MSGARLIIAAFALIFGVACATHDAPIELPLNPYVGHLVTLDAAVGGAVVSMLFDTGAGVTALTPETARAAGCEPFGRLSGVRMSGEQVEFQRCGPMTLSFAGFVSKEETYVFDLGAVLPKDLPPLGGIASLASFADRAITLDLASRKLILETDESLRKRIKDANEGEMRVAVGAEGKEVAILVRIDADPDDLWFLLDSANLDTIVVSTESAASLRFSSPAAGAESEINLNIAGSPEFTTPARVRDIIYDGALNEAVMSRYRITIDLRSKRIWFQPN